MPRKDYRGFLAVVGEQLKQNAQEHKLTMKHNDLDEGILMGYAFALDTLWDNLARFGLTPQDLTWKDFVPERDLLGGLANRKQ